MPKNSKRKATDILNQSTDQKKISDLSFPSINPKIGLEVEVVLEDQILVIDGILSTKECKAFVQMMDNQLPLEITPPPKKGEADRQNYRFSTNSKTFAEHLFTVLTPHLPSFPYPSHLKRNENKQDRKAHSLNQNIRFYKYNPSQYFGKHYDDSVRDNSGAKSEWTLLIYLTGSQDGIEGGETIFYRDSKGKPQEVIVPSLNRGSALLHRHGKDCLLHEGSPVRKGVKYVLRSDLMFKD